MKCFFPLEIPVYLFIMYDYPEAWIFYIYIYQGSRIFYINHTKLFQQNTQYQIKINESAFESHSQMLQNEQLVNPRVNKHINATKTLIYWTNRGLLGATCNLSRDKFACFPNCVYQVDLFVCVPVGLDSLYKLLAKIRRFKRLSVSSDIPSVACSINLFVYFSFFSSSSLI